MEVPPGGPGVSRDPPRGPEGVGMPSQRARRGWEGSGGPPGGLGVLGNTPEGPCGVGRPYRRDGRGREALLEGRKGSVGAPRELEEWLGSPERPEGVERSFQTAGRGQEGQERSGVRSIEPGEVGRPSRRDGQHRKDLSEGQEGYGVRYGWPGFWNSSQKCKEESGVPNRGQEGLQGLPGGQGGVGRPSQSAGKCQEALPKIQDWLRGLGDVGYPSWWAESGREGLPESRQWSGGTPGWTVVVRRPIRMVGGIGNLPKRAEMSWESLIGAGRGHKAHPEGEKGREALLEGREGLRSSPVRPGGVGSPPRRAGRNRRPSRRVGGEGRLSKTARGIGRSSRQAGRGQEALPKYREESGGQKRSGVPPGSPGVVGRLSQRARRVRRLSLRAGRGRKAMLEGREGLGVLQEGLGGTRGPPGELGGFGMLSQKMRGAARTYCRAGRVWEGQERPKNLEGLVGPHSGPGGVVRPFRRFASVWKGQ